MRLPVEKLKPGMELSENLYKNPGDSVPYLSTNIVLTDNIINKLQMSGFKFIPVKIASNIEETISPELSEKTVYSIIKSRINPNDENIALALNSANEMVNSILESPRFSYSLLRYCLGVEDINEETMNVATLAVALGKEYNRRVAPSLVIDLNVVASTCLLYNIGQACEDPSALENLPKVELPKHLFPNFNKDVYSSYSEENIPIYSYAILANNPMIPALTKTSVLFMRETTKGTGPLKVNISGINNRILTIIKIINVCSKYNKLLYEKFSGEVARPIEIIEEMYQDATAGILDKDFTDLLFQTIPIYSIGTRVVLSNGLEAEVIGNNPRFPTRPLIKVTNGGTDKTFDLSKIDNVSIIKIEGQDLLEYNKIRSAKK